MTTWWYADGYKKIGPVEVDEIRRLHQSGKIGSKTMLWHEGVETWQPFDQFNPSGSNSPPLAAQSRLQICGFELGVDTSRLAARLFI